MDICGHDPKQSCNFIFCPLAQLLITRNLHLGCRERTTCMATTTYEDPEAAPRVRGLVVPVWRPRARVSRTETTRSADTSSPTPSSWRGFCAKAASGLRSHGVFLVASETMAQKETQVLLHRRSVALLDVDPGLKLRRAGKEGGTLWPAGARALTTRTKVQT